MYSVIVYTCLSQIVLLKMILQKPRVSIATGSLIKCDKKLEIMQQFRAHYVAFQGSLCGISGLIMQESICNVFQFILSYYTWSKEKKVFSAHLWRYLVH